MLSRQMLQNREASRPKTGSKDTDGLDRTSEAPAGEACHAVVKLRLPAGTSCTHLLRQQQETAKWLVPSPSAAGPLAAETAFALLTGSRCSVKKPRK